MNRQPALEPDSQIHAISQAVSVAADPQVMQIVAMVDAMTQRGHADLLIAPLRQRLTALRPPRPLRFGRLMFYPLDMVIVPAAHWRPDQPAIPRTALMPMAKFVRRVMGPAATAIEAKLPGRTTADTDLITLLGRRLWPAAAAILPEMAIPRTWGSTQLGERAYRPLAAAVATLLSEAVAIDTLHAEAATRLLPPRPEAISAILSRVMHENEAALPMVLAILLDQLPETADLLPVATSRAAAAAIRAAMDTATDLLLRQLEQEDSIETRIGVGTLAVAGAAAGRMVALLKHLDNRSAKPASRERVRGVRQHLDAECQARFASGLQDELLAPLQGGASAQSDMAALELAARGLRVLETEGRTIGGAAKYDLLLDKAAQAISDDAMLVRLSQGDQMRLIEILRGPDAALAMLDRPSPGGT